MNADTAKIIGEVRGETRASSRLRGGRNDGAGGTPVLQVSCSVMQLGRRILGWVWVASVAGSVLLFVAVVGMWERSLRWHDAVGRQIVNYDGGINRGVLSTEGRLVAVDLKWGIYCQQSVVELTRTHGLEWYAFSRKPNIGISPYRNSWLGFHIQLAPQSSYSTNTVTYRYVAVPHWFVALLCLPLPLIAFRRWWKKRRVVREGLCKTCGYDLRASVERCPECGTGIVAGDANA